MKTAKNLKEQTFSPLGALTLETTAYQVCARRFDFGADSAILRHLVQRTFAALDDHDRKNRIQRVAPFTLLLNWRETKIPVCLLNQQMVSQLVTGTPPGQVTRNLRETVFKELLKRDETVAMEDVRRLLSPSSMLSCGGYYPKGGTKQISNIDEYRMDLARLREILSVPPELVPTPQEMPPPPQSVVAAVGPVIEKEGRSTESARSFISHLIALRERFCPPIDQLACGQLIAVALDLRDRRMSISMRYRAHVPVRITLYHEAEIAALERLGPQDRQAIDDILEQRVARILTEAYCQGGLLSILLVSLLTHQSTSRTTRLVNHFESQTRLILPTPGTILDAGSKLTHKAAIVRLHLDGCDCKEIARQTFHSEEAVSRYIDDFERTLIASSYGLPFKILCRILKLSPHVVEQYQALVAEHIGDMDAVKNLISNRGDNIKEATA
jgi:hypothetical protein